MKDNREIKAIHKINENKHVTGYGKTDHFAHNFKIELLVFKGSLDLKQ